MKPIDTLPTAAAPIHCNTTRRERFNAALLRHELSWKPQIAGDAGRGVNLKVVLVLHEV